MPKTAHEVQLPPDVPIERIPVRTLDGRWWRQTDPTYDALSLPERARTGGRCHRKGQQPRLYASSSSSAAWGELFRHASGISPFDIKRTMSTLEVSKLPVVDFDEPVVRAIFDVTEADLVSNRYAVCRRLADLLRGRPDLFGGMILPSAAAPGDQTLVVFKERIPHHVRVVRRATNTTPIRLIRLFEQVLLTLTGSARQRAEVLLGDAKSEIQRRGHEELKRLRGRS